MKKILLLVIITSLFFDCSKNTNPVNSQYTEASLMKYREIAWNDLTQDEKSSVENAWQNATTGKLNSLN